jgi:hypothetical protein
MERKRAAAIAGGALIAGGVVGGFAVVVNSGRNMDLGADPDGVKWSVSHGFASTDMDARVEGENHRVSKIKVIDPKSGKVLGDNSFDVPLFPSTQDFAVVACVDGKWRESPEARTAFRDTKFNITLTNYDGSRKGPADIPDLSADLCG